MGKPSSVRTLLMRSLRAKTWERLFLELWPAMLQAIAVDRIQFLGKETLRKGHLWGRLHNRYLPAAGHYLYRVAAPSLVERW
jgi:hypothetical protein